MEEIRDWEDSDRRSRVSWYSSRPIKYLYPFRRIGVREDLEGWCMCWTTASTGHESRRWKERHGGWTSQKERKQSSHDKMKEKQWRVEWMDRTNLST